MYASFDLLTYHASQVTDIIKWKSLYSYISLLKAIMMCFTLLLYQGCGFPVQGTAVQYDVGTIYAYTYHTEVRINEPTRMGQTSTQPARDVGVVLDAVVHVMTLWSSGPQMLIQVNVRREIYRIDTQLLK